MASLSFDPVLFLKLMENTDEQAVESFAMWMCMRSLFSTDTVHKPLFSEIVMIKQTAKLRKDAQNSFAIGVLVQCILI